MKEKELRLLHRRMGSIVAVFILLQAGAQIVFT